MPKIVEAGLLVILMVIAVALVPSVCADLPPPIEYVKTDAGGLFCIAQNVSMPEVIVNVTIHLTDSWKYDVNVSCAFTITSLIEQNLTTAFVYPSIWTGYTAEQNIGIHEFDIHVNDTATNFTILNYNEFKSTYDLNQTDWDYVWDCDFALFNFSIDSENQIVVNIFASFSSISGGHEFIFEYIVDTARRWEGDTHEIIRMQFNRDNDTEIIDYWYAPDSYLVVSGNNYSALLTWDFSIHDFDRDRVSFVVQQKEFPVYHHYFPPDPRSLILLSGLVVLTLVGSFLVIKKLQHH
jgi:hypothetical protein